MEPAYFEGDHVLTFNWGKLKSRDVVVFSAPSSLRAERSNLKNRLPRPTFSFHECGPRNDNKICFIKRIKKIRGDQVFVSGDNTYMTSKIGPIKYDQIVGKVIWKY